LQFWPEGTWGEGRGAVWGGTAPRGLRVLAEFSVVYNPVERVMFPAAGRVFHAGAGASKKPPRNAILPRTPTLVYVQSVVVREEAGVGGGCRRS